MTIKPGDYIGTCEGTNRKVATIEIDWRDDGDWRRSKPNGTRWIHEVIFTDTNGGMHWAPGGGCAFPAEPPQKVTERIVNRARWTLNGGLDKWYGNDKENLEKSHKISSMILSAWEAGLPVVDAHGEILPEFDSRRYS